MCEITEQFNQDYEELKHFNDIGPLADNFVDMALDQDKQQIFIAE